MPQPRVAPYGSWKSPITTDLIVAETKAFGRIVLDGGDTYWAEQRPSEGGRTVVVRCTSDGRVSDVTPAPFNVRTRVHEYGGGAYTVASGQVYFSHFDDQRLYRQRPGEQPEPITLEGAWRYADSIVDSDRGRLICVREDHTVEAAEPINEIVSVDIKGRREQTVLISGNDFYASPRLSPDGRSLAWLTWNHPWMPWEHTELWVASLDDDGALAGARHIAGGPRESIAQAEWSPDGALYFASDRGGWWNLYRWRSGVEGLILGMEAEFARPHWLHGTSSFGFESASRLVCAYATKGAWRFGRLHVDEGRLEPIDLPYSEMGRADFKVAPDRAVFAAGSPTKPMSLVALDLATNATTVLRVATGAALDDAYLSAPEAIEFPTAGGHTAHAFYYRPRNQDHESPPGEKPPLLVTIHGGPTDATTMSLNLITQYWTSRGFAVLDVNYGGSTGYGRAYRERLNGLWGVVDVDDCVHGALHLVERSEVDPDRLLIHGGSAGGYTALAALTFRDVFSAGASYYGVSDLETLLNDMPKFDTHSLDSLIGPYPEHRHLYRERSPLRHPHRLFCPLIFFHGLEDKIVPPSQAELLYNALREKGVPTAYLAFPDEQHGFRKSDSIKRVLDAELYFYSRVFGFDLADAVEPFPIENL